MTQMPCLASAICPSSHRHPSHPIRRYPQATMLAVRGRSSRSRSSVLAGAAVTVAISRLLLLLLLLLVAAPTCAFSATTKKARALVENLVHDEQCYLTDVRPSK